MTDRSRGFSLIEVIVALTMGSIVMAGALTVFGQVRYTVTEAGLRAEMARDAQLALDLIARDLALLGAGVPAGTCNDASCTPGSSLYPAVRRAGAQGLVFIGDLPYPNAELPGVVSVARFAGDADSARIAVHSELSGACIPYSSASPPAFRCRTTTTTLLPAHDNTAADDCFEGRGDRRTCPWGLHKWQRGNAGTGSTALVAVDVRGNFYARRWSGTTTAVDNAFGVELQPGAAGAAALPRSEFFVSVGGANLVQLDRVFYALEDVDGGGCASDDCVLMRRQCWGVIDDPTAADFPAAGTAFIGSTTTPRACEAPDDGTGWEVVLTGIESFSFRYGVGAAASVDAVPVADLEKIRAVDVSFTVQRSARAGGPVLRHTVEQHLFLGNRSLL